MKRGLLLLMSQLMACQGQDAKPAGTWRITAVDATIATAGTFAQGTELSGGATLDGSALLLASNETRSAQIATLTRDPWRLTAGPEIPLTPPVGKAECDFEAVAVDGSTGFFYVLGSHSVSKQKAHPRPEQEALFRLPVDPATHLPRPVQASPPPSVSLRAWLQRVPEIGKHVGRPLQMNGLNLEGLACRLGNLFIGCRSPSVDGKVAVLETDAATLFAKPEESWPLPTVHWLALGKGMGVRDLAPVQNGFLILAGDAGAIASPKFPLTENYSGDRDFSLFLWQPGQPEVVTTIGKLPEAKGSAEALIVLEETAAAISILILHDGADNGGPAMFTLSKPR